MAWAAEQESGLGLTKSKTTNKMSPQNSQARKDYWPKGLQANRQRQREARQLKHKKRKPNKTQVEHSGDRKCARWDRRGENLQNESMTHKLH